METTKTAEWWGTACSLLLSWLGLSCAVHLKFKGTAQVSPKQLNNGEQAVPQQLFFRLFCKPYLKGLSVGFARPQTTWSYNRAVPRSVSGMLQSTTYITGSYMWWRTSLLYAPVTVFYPDVKTLTRGPGTVFLLRGKLWKESSGCLSSPFLSTV